MCFSTAAGSRPVQPATTACARATSPDPVPDLSCNVRERMRGDTIHPALGSSDRGGKAARRPAAARTSLLTLDMSLTWSFQLREIACSTREGDGLGFDANARPTRGRSRERRLEPWPGGA